jgi:hypothetical protein
MKWLTIRTWKVKCEFLSNWHLWFAWYPVTVKKYPDGARDKVWLKTVMRKGVLTPGGSTEPAFWVFTYKETPQGG